MRMGKEGPGGVSEEVLGECAMPGGGAGAEKKGLVQYYSSGLGSLLQWSGLCIPGDGSNSFRLFLKDVRTNFIGLWRWLQRGASSLHVIFLSSLPLLEKMAPSILSASLGQCPLSLQVLGALLSCILPGGSCLCWLCCISVLVSPQSTDAVHIIPEAWTAPPRDASDSNLSLLEPHTPDAPAVLPTHLHQKPGKQP